MPVTVGKALALVCNGAVMIYGSAPPLPESVAIGTKAKHPLRVGLSWTESACRLRFRRSRPVGFHPSRCL